MTNADENVCEHGDHVAPPGRRFCSPECARCELAECDDADECAGICLRADNETTKETDR